MARKITDSRKHRAMTLLGGRVRDLREAAGVGQHTLAERCGLTVNSVWNIEHGRQNPGVTTLIMLADALDTTVSALVEGI